MTKLSGQSLEHEMPSTDPMNSAPRCTATAKTTRCRCKGPAVKGWSVCRMHGAKGGAPSGPANGRWRHGNRTRSTEAMRRDLVELMALARQTAKALGSF